MTGLGHAPAPLLLVGAAAATAGGLVLMMLLWHLLRRILDRPRVPLSSGVYVFLAVLLAALAGTGSLALAIAAAITDWTPLVPGTAVAELACRRLEKGRLQIAFAEVRADGKTGADETTMSDGPECRLTGELLAFPGPLASLGLADMHRIAFVGDRPRAGTVSLWRALPRPLGIPVARVRIDEVSLPPADKTRYRLYVKPDGYWWEKRSN